MDVKSVMIEMLRQKNDITPLEQDMLDTWDELQKNLFDRVSAEWQARKNNAKYLDMYGAIMALPNTTSIPWEQTTDQEVWSCLSYQLDFLAGKEWGDKVNEKQTGTDVVRQG